MNPYYHSLIAHLWESTLFGTACCLLMLAFGKSSSFSRHLLAWASILKFLIPLSAFSAATDWVRTTLANSATADSQILPYVGTLSQTLQIDTWMEFYTGDEQPSFALPWEAITMAIWTAGIIALCFLWIQQYVRINASINSGCSEAGDSWQNLAKRIWEKSERSMPRIMICQDEDLMAGVFGFRRPAIIIPSSFDSEFSESEREAFLRHEFQHVYKHDNLWLFVQKLIRNLFWVHPLVWWLDRQISAEREIMRDEEVIRKTENKTSYLNCLMKASNIRLPSSYATSVGIKGSPFARRVRAIARNRSSRFMDWLSTLGSIATILTITLFLSTTLPITELRADDDRRDFDDEISEERYDLHQQIYQIRDQLAKAHWQIEEENEKLAGLAARGEDVPSSRYKEKEEVQRRIAYLEEKLAEHINQLGDDGINESLMAQVEMRHLGNLLESDDVEMTQDERARVLDRWRQLQDDDDRRVENRIFDEDDNAPGLTDKEGQRMEEIQMALEGGDSDLAIDLIYDSINDDSSAAFEYLAGNLHMEDGETEKAANFYKVALDKHPNFRNATKNLGVALVKLDKWEEAKTSLLKASSLGAKDGKTHGLLGYCYLNTGDLATAEHHFRIARRKQGENESWQQGLQKVLETKGKRLAEREAMSKEERDEI